MSRSTYRHVPDPQAAKAYCLEPNDLVLAKCAAGRGRDWEFAKEAIVGRVVDPQILLARVEDLPLDEERASAISRRLEVFAGAVS